MPLALTPGARFVVPAAEGCVPHVREPRARRIEAGASIALGGVFRIEAGDGRQGRHVDPPCVPAVW